MDLKRLLSYTASASAFLFGTETAAQVIHTDLNPDLTLDALTMTADGLGQFALDIDSNGVDDFILQALITSTTSGKWETVRVDRVDPLNEMPWPDFPGANPYSAGQQIDNTLPFLDADVRLIQRHQWSSTSINSFTTEGNWKDTDDAYLPIRFKIDENFHFGYIRLGIVDFDGFVLKSYAYEATPETGIAAGALPEPPVVSTGIEENGAFAAAQLWAGGGQLNYSLPDDILKDQDAPTLKIMALNGKVVADYCLTDTKGILPFEHNGIHIAVISNRGGQRAFKLFN